MISVTKHSQEPHCSVCCHWPMDQQNRENTFLFWKNTEERVKNNSAKAFSFVSSILDGTAHLINIWCYVWLQMRCSGWDPSPHFHLSHGNVQSARDAQQAESSGHRVNLQHGVVPHAAPLVAPKRLSVVRALWLTLQGYTEISSDGGPWSSLCLFNIWLLLDLFIYFKNANVWQKVPCLRFLLWKPRKKSVGAVSWLYF